MCNLYSNLTSHQAMQQIYAVSPDHSHLGNMPALPGIFPKGEAPIVAIGKSGCRALVRASWGFLTPNKSKKTGKWNKPSAWNNTRDDKIMTSGLWKGSFAERRCLIPATGYVETTGKQPATYHWFRVTGEDNFAFAGIWQYRKGTVGNTEIDGTFYSMVTTTPNTFAANYHNRMPVILQPDQYESWLRGDMAQAAAMIKPFDGPLEIYAEGEGMNKDPNGAD